MIEKRKEEVYIRNLKLIVAIVVILSLFLAHLSRAEEKKKGEKKAIKLKEIVVTAEKLPEHLVTTTIETSKKIEAGQVNSVTDYMRNTEGITVQQSPCRGKSVNIRGLGNRHYRLMINGVPLADRGKFHVMDFKWEAIPYDNIDKIEVIKGAYSAEYGSRPGGVVNIITRKPPSKGVETTLSGYYGSFKDHKETLKNSGRAGKWGWIITGGHHKAHGYLHNQNLESHDASFNPILYLDKGKEINFLFHTFLKNEGFPLDNKLKWNVWRDDMGYQDGSYMRLENYEYQLNFNLDPLDISLFWNALQREDRVKFSNVRLGFCM